MGQLTITQRGFIVEQFYSNKSRNKVKRVFANEYDLNINIKTVGKVVSKWRASDTIHNLNNDH